MSDRKNGWNQWVEDESFAYVKRYEESLSETCLNSIAETKLKCNTDPIALLADKTI